MPAQPAVSSRCPAGVDRAGSDKHQKEAHMDLWLALFWTGPIGVGVFLAGLGILFWGIAQIRNKN